MTGRTRKRSVSMLVNGKPFTQVVPMYDGHHNIIDMDEAAIAIIHHIGMSGKVTNVHINKGE